jgi:hypothetical protein
MPWVYTLSNLRRASYVSVLASYARNIRPSPGRMTTAPVPACRALLARRPTNDPSYRKAGARSHLPGVAPLPRTIPRLRKSAWAAMNAVKAFIATTNDMRSGDSVTDADFGSELA